MSQQPASHIRGIMLPSGEVLFSEDGATECPWCQLVDMQGCFMHLTCGQGAIRPGRRKQIIKHDVAQQESRSQGEPGSG